MADNDVTEDEFDDGVLVEELDEDTLDDEIGDELIEEEEEEDPEIDDDAFDEAAGEETAEAPAAAKTAGRARRKAKEDEEEVDEEEYDPDDVEADLDTILKDRIAATDDDEEEDEDEGAVADKRGGEAGEGVAPKKANEFTCMQCFLLVNPAQFGKPDNPRCPVGEEDCPSIPRVKKLARKR